jgi:hypothetical protein
MAKAVSAAAAVSHETEPVRSDDADRPAGRCFPLTRSRPPSHRTRSPGTSNRSAGRRCCSTTHMEKSPAPPARWPRVISDVSEAHLPARTLERQQLARPVRRRSCSGSKRRVGWSAYERLPLSRPAGARRGVLVSDSVAGRPAGNASSGSSPRLSIRLRSPQVVSSSLELDRIARERAQVLSAWCTHVTICRV